MATLAKLAATTALVFAAGATSAQTTPAAAAACDALSAPGGKVTEFPLSNAAAGRTAAAGVKTLIATTAGPDGQPVREHPLVECFDFSVRGGEQRYAQMLTQLTGNETRLAAAATQAAKNAAAQQGTPLQEAARTANQVGQAAGQTNGAVQQVQNLGKKFGIKLPGF